MGICIFPVLQIQCSGWMEWNRQVWFCQCCEIPSVSEASLTNLDNCSLVKRIQAWLKCLRRRWLYSYLHAREEDSKKKRGKRGNMTIAITTKSRTVNMWNPTPLFQFRDPQLSRSPLPIWNACGRVLNQKMDTMGDHKLVSCSCGASAFLSVIGMQRAERVACLGPPCEFIRWAGFPFGFTVQGYEWKVVFQRYICGCLHFLVTRPHLSALFLTPFSDSSKERRASVQICSDQAEWFNAMPIQFV